jgi:hypothetical protein
MYIVDLMKFYILSPKITQRLRICDFRNLFADCPPFLGYFIFYVEDCIYPSLLPPTGFMTSNYCFENYSTPQTPLLLPPL